MLALQRSLNSGLGALLLCCCWQRVLACRLQQLQGKPVAVPPGGPAALADTSKVLALIEGLMASASASAASGGAAAIEAPIAAGGRLSSAASGSSRVSTSGGSKGSAVLPALSKPEQVRARPRQSCPGPWLAFTAVLLTSMTLLPSTACCRTFEPPWHCWPRCLSTCNSAAGLLVQLAGTPSGCSRRSAPQLPSRLFQRGSATCRLFQQPLMRQGSARRPGSGWPWLRCSRGRWVYVSCRSLCQRVCATHSPTLGAHLCIAGGPEPAANR